MILSTPIYEDRNSGKIIGTVYFASFITKQVKKGVDFAQALGTGYLTRSITVESKDELGELTIALNKAVENTRALIKETINNSNELSASSEELTATEEEISAQIQTTNARTQEISAGMEESSAAIEQTRPIDMDSFEKLLKQNIMFN